MLDAGRQVVQVGAGAENAAGSVQHGATRQRIGVEVADGARQCQRRGAVERVPAPFATQHDRMNAAGVADVDVDAVRRAVRVAFRVLSVDPATGR